tara:strand:- start:1724 stop:2113 length:390 start_codon:yes stop_codon:yes gene_type:complete
MIQKHDMYDEVPKFLKIIGLLIIVFALGIGNVLGQTKVITQIDNNLYEYRAYNEDGSIHQKGMYIGTEDGKLLVHSYWSDDVGTKALYNRGKLVWIKPKGQPRYTYEQIEFEQMKAEIERLKAIVALND